MGTELVRGQTQSRLHGIGRPPTGRVLVASKRPNDAGLRDATLATRLAFAGARLYLA
jgi:hypothetical protein